MPVTPVTDGPLVKVIDEQRCYNAWISHDGAPAGAVHCWPIHGMIGHIVTTENVIRDTCPSSLAVLLVFLPEDNGHIGLMTSPRWCVVDMKGLEMI